MREIYISTDVETDGPIPGPHSMLSIGSAAYTADKQRIATFSANFEFNNDNLRPEYKGHGWIEFRRANSGRNFERMHDGQLCTPHGALDKKPFPHPQLCFRKFNDGWKIQGHINGGD